MVHLNFTSLKNIKVDKNEKGKYILMPKISKAENIVFFAIDGNEDQRYFTRKA